MDMGSPKSVMKATLSKPAMLRHSLDLFSYLWQVCLAYDDTISHHSVYVADVLSTSLPVHTLVN